VPPRPTTVAPQIGEELFVSCCSDAGASKRNNPGVGSATIQPRFVSFASMARHGPKPWLSLALVAAAALTAGCAGTPTTPAARTPGGSVVVAPRVADATVGGAIAEVAMGMVGTRYRYGGADPREGFDCSGLVYYAYSQAGYRVPRTSQELFRAARKISVRDAGAGDLMFFQDEAKLSHVGIYVGDGLFVHAPSSGEKVSIASLDSPYYREHLVAVGRLLPN
jgi:murein DD-endopeptidase